jgi:Zn-dependent peptidase ImmA (M78 family)/transcriptional regulator with XRE-family HTH domain
VAVGVTDRSIMLFESGRLEPSDDTLTLLAQSLGFPSRFFTATDLEEIPSDAASFRALSKMTASERNAALAASALALALSDWIGERFRLPEMDIPKLGPGIDPETAADVVRTEWGIGEQPISNVLHLLEAHGVRVFSLAEETRDVDAYSFWRSGAPFVFLNTKKSAEHSRLDAAHELGHLVLHWHHEVPQGRAAEQEAQTFASALLMPRAGVISTAPRFPTLADVMTHKRRWRVSAMAYVYRLNRLGLLSEWQYRTLNVEMSKRGYRSAEPHGITRETSQVLTKVFTTLRREGVTKAHVAEALDIYPEDLDALVFGLAILPVTAGGRSGEAASGARLKLVE